MTAEGKAMERVSEQTVGGFHFREIAGSVHIEAQGDVVAGDKKIIQNIRNVYQIHLASNPLAKAPYKFLAFYDIPDRDIFFGRGDAIRALEELVPRHRIVIVSGASGAGKSSLLNAGLIP